jgi:hypothetical protein
MARPAVGQDRPNMDLARLRTALRRLDPSERLQERAPEKTVGPLRVVRNGLQRRIRRFSLSRTRVG